MEAYFFERQGDAITEAGMTVSKNPALPDGDFQIDEFTWPDATLWFVASDKFTADERQLIYEKWKQTAFSTLVDHIPIQPNESA